jgi:hypothetical protein
MQSEVVFAQCHRRHMGLYVSVTEHKNNEEGAKFRRFNIRAWTVERPSF